MDLDWYEGTQDAKSFKDRWYWCTQEHDKVAGTEKVHRVDSIVKHYSTYSQWHPSTHYKWRYPTHTWVSIMLGAELTVGTDMNVQNMAV